jgi:hypothetical protein
MAYITNTEFKHAQQRRDIDYEPGTYEQQRRVAELLRQLNLNVSVAPQNQQHHKEMVVSRKRSTTNGKLSSKNARRQQGLSRANAQFNSR